MATGIKDKVAIIGMGCSRFGERWDCGADDLILEAYVEQDKSPAEIVALGHPAEAVRKVVRLIKIAEYKRRQAPPGIKVSGRSFGFGWRYPITNGASL